ncbi:MAG: FlgO family outer membrane protein [Pseudomonadota bacterium]
MRIFKTAQTGFLVTFIFALIFNGILSSAHADFQKTKIAVLDFELMGDKLATNGMGTILSEWLINNMVKNGRFDVVERGMLQTIISEQKLSSTGIIDERTITALGKILGVKAIITGSLLKSRGTIEMNTRLISVKSGSLIAAENIRTNGDSDLQSLVDQLTDKIIRNFPITGYVVKKNSTSVTIDLGLDTGLSPGIVFIAYREGKVIKHPKTGEVLDVEQIPTGRLRITRVSKNVAEGVIITEEPGGILCGNLVKSILKETAEPASHERKEITRMAPVAKEPVPELKQSKKKVVPIEMHN